MTVVVCLDYLGTSRSMAFRVSLLQSIDLCPVQQSLSQLRLAPNRPCMHVSSIIHNQFYSFVSGNKANNNNVMQCLFEQLTGSVHSGKEFPTW